MPVKSVRAFDFFWYGDNSKVNNNRARGIYDRVQAPSSAMRELGGQSAEAGRSWLCTATWYSVSSQRCEECSSSRSAEDSEMLFPRHSRCSRAAGIQTAVGSWDGSRMAASRNLTTWCRRAQEPEPLNLYPCTKRDDMIKNRTAKE